MEVKTIATIHTDFPTKFGIPRQSGVAPNLRGRIIFEPEFRNPDALRGIEGYSHLWLVWIFSEAVRGTWSPTVRPPRLGGNERMGVFATRSPFRPNAIGLSSVKLEGVEKTENGLTLLVSGADLMDGTPILDIKPYLAYTDSHPNAQCGFTDSTAWQPLQVILPENMPADFPKDHLEALREILSQDPRPSYQQDAERIYGFGFAGFEVRFFVSGNILRVTEIIK